MYSSFGSLMDIDKFVLIKDFTVSHLCFGSLMDIDKFVQGLIKGLWNNSFGSLMDIDKFVLISSSISVQSCFGSLMDIDKFVPEKEKTVTIREFRFSDGY